MTRGYTSETLSSDFETDRLMRPGSNWTLRDTAHVVLFGDSIKQGSEFNCFSSSRQFPIEVRHAARIPHTRTLLLFLRTCFLHFPDELEHATLIRCSKRQTRVTHVVHEDIHMYTAHTVKINSTTQTIQQSQ